MTEQQRTYIAIDLKSMTDLIDTTHHRCRHQAVRHHCQQTTVGISPSLIVPDSDLNALTLQLRRNAAYIRLSVVVGILASFHAMMPPLRLMH